MNVLDLNSGLSRRLVDDIRAGDLAFNSEDESLWGMRHSDGYSSLIRLEPPYEDYRSVHVFDFGHDVLPQYVGRMHAYAFEGYHRDIGNPVALAQAEADAPRLFGA